MMDSTHNRNQYQNASSALNDGCSLPLDTQSQPKEAIYSVSEVSHKIKSMLEGKFPLISIRGELSNVKIAPSGHCYLCIKDEQAVLDGVMWRGKLPKDIRLKDGMEVICRGQITSYPGRSRYQIIIQDIRQEGVGAMMQKIEAVKAKLRHEGIFDALHKKSLPFLPRRIGIITSPKGSVIRDMLHRIRDRFPSHVMVFPAEMQGERSAKQVIEQLDLIETKMPGTMRPDVIIIARGGGSFEDLLPFQDEMLVRRVHQCVIPVISAIGHETDTGLLDFVADRRAPTPTGAAEFAVPVLFDIKQKMHMMHARFDKYISGVIQNARLRVQKNAASILSPEKLILFNQQRLDDRAHQLSRGLLHVTQENQARLSRFDHVFKPSMLRRRIEQCAQFAAYQVGNLHRHYQAYIQQCSDQLRLVNEQLQKNIKYGVIVRHVGRYYWNISAIDRVFSYCIKRQSQKLSTQNRLLMAISQKATLRRGYVLPDAEKGNSRGKQKSASMTPVIKAPLHQPKPPAKRKKSSKKNDDQMSFL